ncbi:uncharacterized protein OCT59_024157 [Rhizophagus irregularis]|uniref:Uncharacterized protein n=2 Tax=Rhizophagus irregularis TaxID=588596 RepID=A0A015I109_RHIIW|nr:hypothetical protein RirG_269030 [Rhizophagus irregularis DAOM 197198w]UZO03754.1 hypothetical protein OCT59_024157 [Rhizophagus irregularis]GBC22337.2 hypothetical protein GLOIN_2v1481471 [Rhizophagus irregularis DAOM 181602=DAOM 197198]CAG8684037.1 19505_t:CDS:2 [Rhizophagus irregularis]
MPAKLSTVCYVHECTERLTQEYTVKEVMVVVRLDDVDPTKVVYLKVKIFIPSDQNIPTQIEDFEKGDVVFLRGKFVACAGWYSINATSLKVMDNLDFDTMPSIGLDIMIIGITTKTVQNVDGKSVLDFYVEENLSDCEPRDFWVEVSHDPNVRYLSNKTNSINQSMRSTTAIIMGTIVYQAPVINEVTQEESSPGKHVINLEDISLISTNRNSANAAQSLNLPWLNAQANGRHGSRSNRSPRGATPRTSRRGRTTLSQMNQPARNQNISAALEANPILTMADSTSSTSHNPISEEQAD